LLLIGVVALGIAAFYLLLYVFKEDPMPIGWDTPRYLSQTQFVAERGLAGVPDRLPPPIKTLDSRAAGFPVIALVLGSVSGTSPFAAAVIMPVAAAVALALAAGAFVSYTLRRPAWQAAIVAVVVGLSPTVVRLMSPETYTDNLFSAALILAAMVPLVSYVREGRGDGMLGAVLLLAAAGLAHPSILGIFLAVMAVAAVLYLPESWRSWRTGGGPASTPTARLAMVAAAGAGLTAAALGGLLRAAPDSPTLTRGELTKKLRQDLPLHLLPVTLPLGAMGVWSLAERLRRFGGRAAGDRSRKRGLAEDPNRSAARFALTLFVAWAGVVAVGVLAFYLGVNSPAHRFLAFFIPLPILVALGLLWARERAGKAIGRTAGAAVLAVGTVGLALLGFRDYYVILPDERGVEWLETPKVQEAASAASYLDAVGVRGDDPVVFVVDDLGLNPLSYVPEMAYILRSALPAERIENAYFYVGDPERYLAGEPTYRTSPPTYNVNANRFWPTIRRLLPGQPVALLLSSYNPAYGEFVTDHPEAIVAPNVAVLHGPAPDRSIEPPPIPTGLRGLIPNAVFDVATLALLVLVGAGWVIALVPSGGRPFEVLALAPAFGIGSLILVGVLVDTAGFRLGGAGGVVTVAAAAGVGMAFAAGRLRRNRASATGRSAARAAARPSTDGDPHPSRQ
jgi:MFS family permease